MRYSRRECQTAPGRFVTSNFVERNRFGDAERPLQSYRVIELPETPEGNDHFRIVASLDRKRLGQTLGASGISIRGVFDEETRRKPLAFAADAVRYGI